MSTINKLAWNIRRTLAESYDCTVNEISWGTAYRAARIIKSFSACQVSKELLLKKLAIGIIMAWTICAALVVSYYCGF